MTVVFNFERVFQPFISRMMPRLGILHKESWVAAGADDNPADVTLDPIIGSGPFRVTQYQEGSSSMQLESRGDHHLFNPDHDLIFQSFQEQSSIIQAFKQGTIHMAPDIGSGAADNIAQSMSQDMIFFNPGFLPYVIYPQYNFGPTKHLEFRKAVAMALNRQQITDLSFGDENEPSEFVNILQPKHPFHTPEDMLERYPEDPTGAVDAARAVLEDAGWGWDGEGRLHYPPDADLSPLWPAGEEPTAEQFPCLNELN
jgi:peptide/nickel transport system substrate-binding protein